MSIISKIVEDLLHGAFVQGRKKRQSLLTADTLFLVLLDDPGVAKLLTDLGANLEQLRREATKVVEATVPRLADD